jgi:tRNA pseudouridine55 synthase
MPRNRSNDGPALTGLLVIDKPVGWTSHDVVARLRRLIGVRRIGHAGTLDPFATGVLPIAVGRATRLLQYIQAHDKHYLTVVALGVETDSGDLTGALAGEPYDGPWPAATLIESTLAHFVGEIEQVPPAFSAIKVGGERLYRQARAGRPVEVPTRRVVIHQLRLLAYDPPYLLLLVHCATGTYVRALARDIGRLLGCGAYCHALRRTAVGRFCIGDAWTLDELAELALPERWPQIAFHPDHALRDRPAAILSEEDMKKWYHGRPVRPDLTGVISTGLVRAYGAEGQLLGLAASEPDGTLKPSLVLATEGEG